VDDPLGPFDESDPFVNPGRIRRETREIVLRDNIDLLLVRAREILRESGPALFSVLVIAENEVWREEILASLRSAGLEGIPYRGKRSVEKAFEHRAGMVLIEGGTGEHPGLRICRQITTDRRTRETPVLVFSADRTRTAILHASRIGAASYLVAPFTREALLTKIAEIQTKRTAARPPIQPPPEASGRG
jgi:DNA-binding response OmpR family regulator